MKKDNGYQSQQTKDIKDFYRNSASESSGEYTPYPEEKKDYDFSAYQDDSLETAGDFSSYRYEDYEDLPLERKSLIPPGFRTRKIWKMIVSVIYYLFVLDIGLTYNTYSPLPERIIEGFSIGLTFLLLFWFPANYLDMHKHLPLCKSDNKIAKTIGIILGCIVIFFGIIFIMVMLEDILF